MPFSIVRNDITLMSVDAIVNSANPNAVIGGGVDWAIHKAAGASLIEARKKIGPIATGSARITPGYNLKAKYVIHTVGPVWQGGDKSEEQLLALAYTNSLKLAVENCCESVAFPLISSGIFGYPKAEALQVAINAISRFLVNHEIMVYLVVLDKNSFAASEKLLGQVESYISEKYVPGILKSSYAYDYDTAPRRRRLRSATQKNILPPEDIQDLAVESDVFSAARPSESLESYLSKLDLSFSQRLLQIIDEKGLTDPEVYKKANIDRKLFNKIKNNPDYKPKKPTAIAFAIALELSLEETKDLISRAGFALTHSNKFDIIIEYFIINGIYDMFRINEILFAYDMPLIGA